MELPYVRVLGVHDLPVVAGDLRERDRALRHHLISHLLVPAVQTEVHLRPLELAGQGAAAGDALRHPDDEVLIKEDRLRMRVQDLRHRLKEPAADHDVPVGPLASVERASPDFHAQLPDDGLYVVDPLRSLVGAHVPKLAHKVVPGLILGR